MTQALNIHHQLYRGGKILKDPGTGGTIYVTQDLQICEMVSVGANETRTLAAPTKPGIRFVLRMLTDGGDIVVTAAAGFNAALETTATFADAGDMLSLISVSLTATTYRGSGTLTWSGWPALCAPLWPAAHGPTTWRCALSTQVWIHRTSS